VPVGTAAGEIADAEPELRQVAAEVIAFWVEEGTRYLATRGLSETDARAVIYALLAACRAKAGELAAAPRRGRSARAAGSRR
jgi:hypothetical protein